MPFWWHRRRRFWIPRRQYRKRNTFRRRRWPKRRRRRLRRRPRRRRRRRRYKVRRKKQRLILTQWQPDSIVKCKIKGYNTLVLGAQGKQLVCWTNVKQANTPPKAPGGGGFGCEQFSLGSLYTEYQFRKNIWTKSNILKDLCRYLGVKMVFYRHPETDFIVAYHRQPPFEISKEIYTSCHPAKLLLSKHKFLILSKSTKPNGKLTKKKYIKPPKQMLNKWFFQEHFSIFPLVMLQAAACNLNYSNIGCCNTNQMLTFFYLNKEFYQSPHWSKRTALTQPYLPYTNFPTEIYTWNQKDMDSGRTTALDSQKFERPTTYLTSVNYDTGFFKTQLLQAVQITKSNNKGDKFAHIPVNICRYNPNLDSGKGNSIWLVSTFGITWDKPPTDKVLVYEGLPLYEMLFGWLSYVQYVKKAPDFFLGYVIVLVSPALLPYSQTGAETNMIIPLDNSMINGKAPYEEDLTSSMKGYWMPNIYNQLPVLNKIVESGPLVPKYSQTKNSTWELDMFYTFYFKWGGPEVTEPPVADPHLQGTYEVPDTIKTTLQIRNPAKQKACSLLHPWDIRHGFYTKTALKRMYENLSTDSTFEPDTEAVPHKKKKTTGPELTLPQEEEEEVQKCLLSLCEESIFQETQQTDILQLLRHQHQQQQQLKYNILRIISDLKDKQNQIKLQTGMLP
nr:MAG: ORF1 [Torque teno midi virus]